MKELGKGETYFDEKTDGYIPIPPGVYPAHAKTLEIRDRKGDGTPFANNCKVFDVTFQIADEVGTMQVPHLIRNGDNTFTQSSDTDGNPSTVNGSFLKGKHFRSNGVWITPNPNEGEGWRNRRYIEFFQGCGVDFPEQDGKKRVMEVEESDIIGMPVLVKLVNETYTNMEGEERVTMKVSDTLSWADGTKLDAAELTEDVPF